MFLKPSERFSLLHQDYITMLIFFTSNAVMCTANAVKQGFQSIFKVMYLLCNPLRQLALPTLLIL